MFWIACRALSIQTDRSLVSDRSHEEKSTRRSLVTSWTILIHFLHINCVKAESRRLFFADEICAREWPQKQRKYTKRNDNWQHFVFSSSEIGLLNRKDNYLCYLTCRGLWREVRGLTTYSVSRTSATPPCSSGIGFWRKCSSISVMDGNLHGRETLIKVEPGVKLGEIKP